MSLVSWNNTAQTSSPCTAIVTGAASGIGRATAELLLEKGWIVAMVDINEMALKDAANGYGPNAVIVRADLSEAESISSVVMQASERFRGRLDLLVNSAGLLWSGDFEKQSTESISRILSVNNEAMAQCTHAAFPLLQRCAQLGGKPTVVNLSSASAVFGIPGMAVYSASKFWVRGFTEALAIEWGRYGISVRDVMPPFVNTPMIEGLEGNPFRLRLGNELTPQAVAAEVYTAKFTGPTHRLVTTKLKLLMMLTRILPVSVVRLRLRSTGRYVRRKA